MVRLISENHRDQMATYDLGDGRRVNVDVLLIERYGLKETLRSMGVSVDAGNRISVFQEGVKIGSVPAYFHPSRIVSTSFLYEPRGGDFTWKDGCWVASPNLGDGDFEAIEGFVWDRATLAELTKQATNPNKKGHA